MKLFLDCLPCLLNQALEISRIVATDDFDVQKKIMEKSIKIISNYEKYENAPELARDIHMMVKDVSGNFDPYSEIKKRHIADAIKLSPIISEFLEKKDNSLYWTLKTAAAGNVLDAAMNMDIDINKCLNEELSAPFELCDLDKLNRKLENTKNILIVGDNAGESVFDTFLVKYFTNYNVYYAVRSEPIINDTTQEDAVDSGLAEYATIISTGCNAPGLIMREADEEFKKILEDCEIVIAKGQGNFEALSDTDLDVFFLLKAKCPMIASRLGVGLQRYAFIHSSNL